jgi:hypothetical protein
MGMILIPTHAKWKTFKKECGVADGAVSGINVGKALDAYDNAVKTGIQYAKANAEAAAKLEGVLATYIQKLDKKKVKDYAKFQKKFLDDYVGAAKAKAEDFKRYSADAETYKKELASFFSMVQRFPVNGTTDEDLQKFKSGPLRGLSAVGSGLKDASIDLTPIDKRAADIQKLIEAAKGKGVKLAGEIGTEAKKQNLV